MVSPFPSELACSPSSPLWSSTKDNSQASYSWEADTNGFVRVAEERKQHYVSAETASPVGLGTSTECRRSIARTLSMVTPTSHRSSATSAIFNRTFGANASTVRASDTDHSEALQRRRNTTGATLTRRLRFFKVCPKADLFRLSLLRRHRHQSLKVGSSINQISTTYHSLLSKCFLYRRPILRYRWGVPWGHIEYTQAQREALHPRLCPFILLGGHRWW